ncbi:MAG: serine hydrolase domain-containing protein, partial [Carnobacterium maltaromaticum]
MKKKIRTILALMLLLICVGAVGFFSVKYSTSLFNQPDSKNIKKVLATSEENSKESSNEASSESSKEPEKPVVPDTQGAEMMANLDVPNDGSQYPELTQEIEKALNKDTFIGSVLVVKDGKVMLNKGYGFADKSQNIGNSFQSLFYIGSVQKSVTAVGIMKLVDEGKLKVDDPVSNFYPNLKGGAGITVRQLLTHMSGIQGRKKPTVAMTHQQVVEDIVNQTVLKDSGQWHYSNDNYSLLAGIIEQVSGKGYSEFIRDTILAPAGLSHTGFYDTFNSALFHANPYQKANTD